MLYRSFLIHLALAASVNAQAAQLSSLLSKWMTVSGFPELLSQLNSELFNFAMTQEFVTDLDLLTETDPAVLITATGITSLDSAIFEIFSNLVATATDMALSDRAKFESEIMAVITSVTSTEASILPSTDLPNIAGLGATDYGMPTPSPSSEETPTKPTVATTSLDNAAGLAGMGLLSVSCAVAALIVAVAVAL